LREPSNQRWEVINRHKHGEPEFDFRLSRPSGPLADFVQGIWSVSVPDTQVVEKPLFSDAGSGIIFNLSGGVSIGHHRLPEGVIMLPVSKQAETIVLSPGARLAGIRFYPAIGFGVLGRHYDQPTPLLSPLLSQLQSAPDQPVSLDGLHARLNGQQSQDDHIQTLSLWAEQSLDFSNVIPASLKKALACMNEDQPLGQMNKQVALSQRQIERLCKHRLGMTPKYYQRVLRIRNTIQFLRLHRTVSLAEVASQFGFSDQAHMTREFQTIARMTPGQIQNI